MTEKNLENRILNAAKRYMDERLSTLDYAEILKEPIKKIETAVAKLVEEHLFVESRVYTPHKWGESSFYVYSRIIDFAKDYLEDDEKKLLERISCEEAEENFLDEAEDIIVEKAYPKLNPELLIVSDVFFITKHWQIILNRFKRGDFFPLWPSALALANESFSFEELKARIERTRQEPMSLEDYIFSNMASERCLEKRTFYAKQYENLYDEKPEEVKKALDSLIADGFVISKIDTDISKEPPVLLYQLSPLGIATVYNGFIKPQIFI